MFPAQNASIESCDMQRVDEYRFYALGQRLQRIKGIEPDSPLQEFLIPLWEARDAIDALLNDPLELRVCGPVAEELRKSITSIVPTEFRDAMKKVAPIKTEGQPDQPKVVGYDAYELNTALDKFEPVLAAECAALDTYVISQKRGYQTSDLVDHTERMLPLESLGILPAGVAADLRASGRCLAFDTPTASGFHVLRAVEAVMALYYRHLTGKELPKQNRNWGIYLQKLKTVPSHDPKILGALDHVRENLGGHPKAAINRHRKTGN